MIFGLEISGEFGFGSELFADSGIKRRKGEKDESKTSVESKPKLLEELGVIVAVEIK